MNLFMAQSKFVLITGVSKGIGASIAKRLAQESYNILGIYNKDSKGASSVRKYVEAQGKQAYMFSCDITNDRQLKNVFADIKKITNTIDVLVNNAGIFDDNDGPFAVEVFKRIFEVNFLGQVKVTKLAKDMINKGGSIIFVSSIHGEVGTGRPAISGYSAIKAALNSYVKNLARALAPQVRVNAVAPGRTLTPMWGNLTEEEQFSLVQDVLIKRWIHPDEVADAVWFLINNTALCGEILRIDGGVLLGCEI